MLVGQREQSNRLPLVFAVRIAGDTRFTSKCFHCHRQNQCRKYQVNSKIFHGNSERKL